MQFLYKSGDATRRPGGWGFQNFYTIGTWRYQGLQPIARTPLPQEIHFALISFRGWLSSWTI